ncbi:uncharacterized protein LOC119103020 [Pollicipes pollicipes]|uniref:uncharacterized protein LOC119103020 n=1 Tax=Pollicipes pollicipes TaxID=41117 RepID=UPI0018853DF0|nr:uncharacterized protein LOC119103020 [Pollicipes pollicipes]
MSTKWRHSRGEPAPRPAGLVQPPAEPRLFAGVYSTVLRTSIVTSTTATDFFTCFSTFSTTFQCGGRRKRRSQARHEILPGPSSPELDGHLHPATREELLSSLGEHGLPREEHAPTPADKDKLLLTIFTTSTTTATLSTKTINTATTVSIIYFCSTSNMSTFPSCG